MTVSAIKTHKQIKRLLTNIEQRHADINSSRQKIGEILATLRHDRALTYRAAATGIGCDPSDLSKLEKGLIWSLPLVDRAITFYLGVSDE